MRGGAKPGERRGGRKKGTPNRRTLAKTQEKKALAQAGITPLEHMLTVMRDTRQPDTVRNDMAKAAAPYFHPKLANVTHKGDAEAGDVVTRMSSFEVVRRITFLLELATRKPIEQAIEDVV